MNAVTRHYLHKFLCNLYSVLCTHSGTDSIPMNLRDAKRSLKRLTPNQLRKLDEWLHELLEQTGKIGSDRAHHKHDGGEEKRAGRKTYRLERVRCGSEKCKCVSGELHGPYWYAYWSEGGKTRSMYLGKKKPTREHPTSGSRQRSRK